jgi:hypothetical protein
MKNKAKNGKKKAAEPSDEEWGPVQVAAFMKLSYQTARNHMLAGLYGDATYSAKHRRLTVLASRVRMQRRAEREERAQQTA